jgi:hypothetical protein
MQMIVMHTIDLKGECCPKCLYPPLIGQPVFRGAIKNVLRGFTLLDMGDKPNMG